MNDTKTIMCNILVELKHDNLWTYDQILSIQENKGAVPLTRKQLTSILKHQAEGVSIKVIDDLFYSLGFTTQVVLGTRFSS